MGQGRTLLNKNTQGRKKGLLACAREVAPLSRQKRMNTPFGTVSENRFTRAVNVMRIERQMADALAEQRA